MPCGSASTSDALALSRYRSILGSRYCGLFTALLALIPATSLGVYALIFGSYSLLIVGAPFAGLFMAVDAMSTFLCFVSNLRISRHPSVGMK